MVRTPTQAILPWAGPALVACWAAVLVASFVKPDWTRNDFERFEDLRLLTAFFVLFVVVSGIYISVYAQRVVVSTPRMTSVTLASAALLLASFPVASKDPLGYAFLGRMLAHYHVNPMSVAPDAFAEDPWYVYLSGQPVSIYGPLFYWHTWLIDVAGGGSFWSAVWLHKAFATACLLASLWLAQALVPRTAANASTLVVLLLWNPLLLLESAAGGHNDIVMVLLLVAALCCWQRDQASAALALLAISFWYKWYSIIFIPIFLIATLRSGGFAPAFRQAAIYAGALVVVGVIAVAPLPGALSAIVGEWTHPQKMSGIFPNELSPVLAALFWTLYGLGLFATDLGLEIFNWTRFGLFAVCAGAVALRQWRTMPGPATIAQGCFLIGLAAFMLLITQLWPWHLLVVVVLGILSAEEPFVLIAVLLTVLGLLSYFLTFAVAALLLILIAGALWLLRRRGGAYSQIGGTSTLAS